MSERINLNLAGSPGRALSRGVATPGSWTVAARLCRPSERHEVTS
jgi:hypothetical protein